MTDTLTAAGFPAATRSATWSIAPTRPAACRKTRSSSSSAGKPDFEVVSDGILVAEANNRGEPFVKLGPDAQISKDVASRVPLSRDGRTPARPARQRSAEVGALAETPLTRPR